MPARAIGLAVRYSELLVAEQLGNTTFGTARHITTTLRLGGRDVVVAEDGRRFLCFVSRLALTSTPPTVFMKTHRQLQLTVTVTLDPFICLILCPN